MKRNLTNLGNVQATVLDRATAILDNDTLVTGYKADISLAHDYYPFGMLMPGRYVSDTAQKCVTINTTVLVPVVVKVYLVSDGPISYKNGDPNTVPVHNLPVALLAADEHPYVYHYNDASSHPGGQVVTGALVEGRAEYSISLSEEPSGGVTAFFIIHPDTNVTNQEVGFDLDLPDDVYAEVRVRQYQGTGEEYDEALGWMAVDMSGAQQLSVPMNKAAIGAGGKTTLELRYNSSTAADFPGDVLTGVRNFYYKITHYEPQTRIATICDEKDSYRFGAKTQEKVNEVAGIGNHYTAMYWEYDTRTGRRWNLDPKPHVSYSLYSAFQNNPIFFSDILGDSVRGTTEAARNAMAKYGEKTYLNKRGKEKVNPDYEPAFGEMYHKWKTDPNVIVNFTTASGDGTIGYEGKNENGQDIYNVIWDPSITQTLGASGIFEESFHLMEAIEGIEMAYAKNSDGSHGMKGLDIYDEVRAKQWVGLNIKSFKETFDLNGNQYGYTHYGFIKSLRDRELIKKVLMEGAPYLPPKSRINMNTNTTIGGSSTTISTYQPSHFGSQYRNFSSTEKKP